MKCKCHPNSPFLWKNNTSPTVFAKDPYFRSTNGSSGSVLSTKRVEESRAKGLPIGYMYGISRNKEAELLRIRTFTTFTKAIASTPTKE